MKQAALEKLLRYTKQFIKLRTHGHLWNALKKIHYADIATLLEYLTQQERLTIVKLFLNKEDELSHLGEIISEIKPEIAIEILSPLEQKHIIAILEELPSDLDETTTAGDAISAIQLANEEDLDVPFYLYVIDEGERLKGVVSLKQLILMKPKSKLKELMTTEIYKVDVFTDQEEVAAVVADYNLLAIPVVDETDKLVGVVTVDDIIDIIQEEATEDIYKLAGVTQDYSPELGLKESLFKRLPWLFMSLFTTSLSAVVVALFQGTIEQVIILAILMHMIPAIGGVVGNQTVAIMVREIVLGNLEWKRSRKILLKELVVSLGSGISIGIVASIITSIIYNRLDVGIIFGISIIINLFIAALFGTMIPLFLKKLKLDPALASGMIVTMVTDVMGLFEL